MTDAPYRIRCPLCDTAGPYDGDDDTRGGSRTSMWCHVCETVVPGEVEVVPGGPADELERV